MPGIHHNSLLGKIKLIFIIIFASTRQNTESRLDQPNLRWSGQFHFEIISTVNQYSSLKIL